MKLYSSLLAILFSTPVFAQEAPFGMKWGETYSQIESRNIGLTQIEKMGAFTAYRALSLPANLSISEFYNLVIHEKYGLQKIIAVSKNIENDIAGSDGKELFNKYASAIAEKYGPPTGKFEHFGRKLYDEYDEFYQCLKYPGCGMWASVWDLRPNGTIGLEIKGIERGKGYLVFTYEGNKWTQAYDEQKNTAEKNDKDAL